MITILWDKNKTYKSIELRESSSEPWNCTLKEYRDRQLKAKRMEEEAVAQVLEVNATEVGKKLHNLRCQMNSELRKIKNKKSGRGAHDVVNREFFDAL